MTEKDLLEVCINCVIPSIIQIVPYVIKLLGWSIVCRLGWVFTIGINAHLISGICGSIVLIQTVEFPAIYIFVFSIISYVTLDILERTRSSKIGYIYAGGCITVLAICELIQTNTKIWHQIRGIQMIATMKVISLAFDIDSRKIDKLPKFIQYYGYLFCPANCILGPWISYDTYMRNFNEPVKFKIKWMLWMIINTIVSIIFLILSNCFVSMLVSDFSWKWFVAYRDALTFRCSHYFVSFLSQATMTAAGLVSSTSLDDSNIFGIMITKPHLIEFPRSLVQVVVHWSIPMHKWLKDYIFRKMKIYGNGIAIFTTYFVSSLLHGLNFQLSAVLLSLGFYTFIEYNIRHKIASIFSACVLSSHCKKNCSHNHKWNSPLVLLINFGFSIIAIIHLAYLGVMFEDSNLQDEGYSMEHTLSKWKNLNFTSHWIAVFFYIFHVFI